MTTDELLKIVEARGLKVKLQNGQPVLVREHGDQSATPKLLAVLKRHRDRIIAKLSPQVTLFDEPKQTAYGPE